MAIDKNSETYADGIAQIHLVEGVVRIDFMRLQPGQDGAPPIQMPTDRIIMTPQGFLRSFDAMQQMINKFVEAGLLKRNEPPTQN